MNTSAGDVTRLLNQWKDGDSNALDELLPLVYRELRKIAKRSRRRENGDDTLQSTDVVHEAFLKLVGDSGRDWTSRSHFFAVAAKAMRQVLVHHARSTLTKKRGGHWKAIDFDEALMVSAGKERQIVALDEALTALAALDPRKGRVVELRYFAGLSIEDTASALKVSPKTIARDWGLAKAFLKREIVREH